MGTCIFRGIQTAPHKKSNRFLLAEFCHATETIITNILLDHDNEQLVIYHELSATPMQTIMPNQFAQIDFILCGMEWQSLLKDTCSFRHFPLASHHFILQCSFKEDIRLEKHRKNNLQSFRPDFSLLKNIDYRRHFTETFKDAMTDTSTARNIDEQLLDINMCIHFSMIACIPSSGIIKKKPWISPVTLELLERKQAYRVQNNFEMEKSTHKLIKKQVKKDRSCWLDEMISTGGWKDIKRFRKIVKRKTHNRQLRNTDGSIIEESQRSQSMTNYFEKYQ